MFTLILALVILLTLGGSGWGYSRYGPVGGIGPLGVLVLVLCLLYYTGNLNF